MSRHLFKKYNLCTFSFFSSLVELFQSPMLTIESEIQKIFSANVKLIVMP